MTYSEYMLTALCSYTMVADVPEMNLYSDFIEKTGCRGILDHNFGDWHYGVGVLNYENLVILFVMLVSK